MLEKINGLLRKKNTNTDDSKTKRNEDGWGWKRLKQNGNDDFEKFSFFFFKLHERWRSSIKTISEKLIFNFLIWPGNLLMDILSESQLVIFSSNAIFITFPWKVLQAFSSNSCKFEAVKAGSGVGFLRLTAVWCTAISCANFSVFSSCPQKDLLRNAENTFLRPFLTDDSLQWAKGFEPAVKSYPVRRIAVKEWKRHIRHISQTIEWLEEIFLIHLINQTNFPNVVGSYPFYSHFFLMKFEI